MLWPEVVFHIAAAELPLAIEIGELAEDLLRALAHDVGQHVQPAAMGHRHDDFVGPLLPRFFDCQVEQGNKALGAFQRKTFGSQGTASGRIPRSVAALPQVVENPILLAAAEFQPILGALHPHLQPLADLQIVDMHELHADRPAISVTQPLNHAAQRHHLRPFDRVRREGAIQIGFR